MSNIERKDLIAIYQIYIFTELYKRNIINSKSFVFAYSSADIFNKINHIIKSKINKIIKSYDNCFIYNCSFSKSTITLNSLYHNNYHYPSTVNDLLNKKIIETTNIEDDLVSLHINFRGINISLADFAFYPLQSEISKNDFSYKKKLDTILNSIMNILTYVINISEKYDNYIKKEYISLYDIYILYSLSNFEKTYSFIKDCNHLIDSNDSNIELLKNINCGIDKNILLNKCANLDNESMDIIHNELKKNFKGQL